MHIPFIEDIKGEFRIGMLQNSLYFKILYSTQDKSKDSGTLTSILKDHVPFS